ncbi:DUF1365 domain-containing protein [Candidatus Pelagibacter communis]|uniref:DUF1365 domain-containing protein n=1 Tax=Pelagibacter ubique TaxID=198252 RepID=UPI00094C225B|nr:DUF1365 domain-containing protein [Candidatus Pelagibacter ubique]
MINNSCIYVGSVIHKRFKPKKHFFKYDVFSLFLDLDEINELDKKIPFFSYNKFNILSFFDKDHGYRDGSSIKDWLIHVLKKKNISTISIKIKILCYPRIFGYVFNPLSIFFIYDIDSNPIAILYEVKNTFGEQHTYVFKIDIKNKQIFNNCKKKFYVSPFMDLESKYFFKVLIPSERLSVIIDQRDKEGKLLFASQDGVRVKLSSKNLLKSYLKHPLMTLKIISAIHYEALKLWMKGIKLVKKNLKIKNNTSYEN